MRGVRAWGIRLAGLFRRARHDRELAREIESHLQLHIDDNLRAGMTGPEARRQALISLGGVESLKETYRDRSSIPALETLAQDVRFAVRMLRKAPGFSAIAVLILALGIGANAAMFSFVNALLLRPLNGGAAGSEIVGLYTQERSRPDTFRAFSYPEYLDIRDRNPVFAGVFAETVVPVGLTESQRTTRVLAALVSSTYFSTLGAQMAVGRNFTASEETPGRGTAVAIVSYSYWKRHGLDPAIIGRDVQMGGRPFTIVGVAPDGFNGTMPVISSDVWVPLGSAELLSDRGLPVTRLGDRSAYALLVRGLLKPGLTSDTAAPLLTPLAEELAATYPEHNRDRRLTVHSLSRLNMGPQPRSDTSAATGAAVFMFMSALVLLIACLNLANMLLARGTGRQREIAIRLALGGSRARVMRQLVTEGFLLSAMGGVAALFLARWAGDMLVASLAGILPVTIAIDISVDIRVVTATMVACVASTMIFCLGPAWTLSQPDVMSRIRQSAAERGGPRGRRFALPNVLVAGQIALSVALVIAAGLFVRARAQAADTDPGFNLAGGLIAELDADLIGYDEARGRAVFAELLDDVRPLQGVHAASLASIVPFGSAVYDRNVERVGGNAPAADPVPGRRPGIRATYTVVGADYFASIGLPMVGGREFTAFEERSAAAAPVAIIDQTLAQRLFPGEHALGQSVRLGESRDQPTGELAQIVGIVAPVRDDVIQPAPAPHVYVPFGRHYQGGMTLHVKTAGDSDVNPAMLDAVRRVIQSVDDRLPILSVMTMTRHRDASAGLWAIRLAATLFTTFGSIALLLAVVGVYGLRAYLVAQRTREFGIRMALGATPGSVVGQIMREGALVSALGLAGGLVLALGLGQVLSLSGMLFDVGPFDPLVLLTAPAFLAGAVAAASYVPARRALRLDPVAALRPD